MKMGRQSIAAEHAPSRSGFHPAPSQLTTRRIFPYSFLRSYVYRGSALRYLHLKDSVAADSQEILLSSPLCLVGIIGEKLRTLPPEQQNTYLLSLLRANLNTIG